MGGAMFRWIVAAVLVVAGFAARPAVAQTSVAVELAPGGRLRVGLLVTNPVLTVQRPDGTLGGMSPELGRFLASKLGAKFEPVTYQEPRALNASYGTGSWDILIGPRGAAVADRADFSPDVMLVDNLYIAAPARDFVNANQVDRAGVRIAVARDGAPDQFLSRTLKHAELVRIVGETNEVVDTFRTGKADLYASNGESVFLVPQALPGTHILDGAVTTVHMAVALPKGKSAAAQAELARIVEEAKTAGIARAAITQQNMHGVRPAP